jgi:hypothetical protein
MAVSTYPSGTRYRTRSPSGTRYRTLAASSSLREDDTIDHLRS